MFSLLGGAAHRLAIPKEKRKNPPEQQESAQVNFYTSILHISINVGPGIFPTFINSVLCTLPCWIALSWVGSCTRFTPFSTLLPRLQDSKKTKKTAHFSQVFDTDTDRQTDRHTHTVACCIPYEIDGAGETNTTAQV